MPENPDLPADPAPSIEAMLDEGERRLHEENPLVAHITDRATGLCNEAYTRMKLADEIKRARRFDEPLTLVLVCPDLDTGDTRALESALVEISGVFLLESRDIDHLARVGPDQLLMVLPHTDEEGGITMARRVLESVASRSVELADGQSLTASAAVVSFARTGADTPEALISRVRDAISEPKGQAPNSLRIWTEAGLRTA